LGVVFSSVPATTSPARPSQLPREGFIGFIGGGAVARGIRTLSLSTSRLSGGASADGRAEGWRFESLTPLGERLEIRISHTSGWKAGGSNLSRLTAEGWRFESLTPHGGRLEVRVLSRLTRGTRSFRPRRDDVSELASSQLEPAVGAAGALRGDLRCEGFGRSALRAGLGWAGLGRGPRAWCAPAQAISALDSWAWASADPRRRSRTRWGRASLAFAAAVLAALIRRALALAAARCTSTGD
jgi:hypothetical protein